MKTVLAYCLLGLLLILCAALVYLMLWPRPHDTTAPWVFSGDGAALNYCDPPELDGIGPSADDIPKAYTPNCGYTQMPMPVLQDCREPLSPGVPDMRGLWLAESGFVRHVERIEQCGNRMVVTTAGIIHDFRMDGTLKNGARDIQSACTNFASAIHVDKESKVVFRPFDLFDTVSRHLDGENMVFTFVNGLETRMSRACYLPENSKGMYEAGS